MGVRRICGVLFFSSFLMAGPGNQVKKMGRSIKYFFNGCSQNCSNAIDHAQTENFKDDLQDSISDLHKKKFDLEVRYNKLLQKSRKYSHTSLKGSSENSSEPFSEYTHMNLTDLDLKALSCFTGSSKEDLKLAELFKELNGLAVKIRGYSELISQNLKLLEDFKNQRFDWQLNDPQAMDPACLLNDSLGSQYLFKSKIGNVVLSRTLYGLIYSLYPDSGNYSYDFLFNWKTNADNIEEYLSIKDFLRWVDLIQNNVTYWFWLENNVLWWRGRLIHEVFIKENTPTVLAQVSRSMPVTATVFCFENDGEVQRNSFDHFAKQPKQLFPQKMVYKRYNSSQNKNSTDAFVVDGSRTFQLCEIPPSENFLRSIRAQDEFSLQEVQSIESCESVYPVISPVMNGMVNV